MKYIVHLTRNDEVVEVAADEFYQDRSTVTFQNKTERITPSMYPSGTPYKVYDFTAVAAFAPNTWKYITVKTEEAPE